MIGEALAGYGLPFEPGGRDADVVAFGARADHDDFVAEDGGLVVGVVSIGPQGAPGRAWVSKLFVDRAQRGRGLGRALLERAHGAARARGYVEVSLRTRTELVEALALYRASGYVITGNAESPGDVILHRAL